MKLPSGAGAKLPTSLWKSQCAVAPLTGWKRCIRLAGMSQYQSACCSGCHSGLSPSSAGVSMATRTSMRLTSQDGDVELHPGLERRAGRERDQPVRGRLGHVDRVADVADRLDTEIVAVGRRVDDEVGQ